MSRFDYVKYDKETTEAQVAYKLGYEMVDKVLNILPASREKALAITKLEESYMWVGKALRNNQAARDAATQLNESRDSGSVAPPTPTGPL